MKRKDCFQSWQKNLEGVERLSAPAQCFRAWRLEITSTWLLIDWSIVLLCLWIWHPRLMCRWDLIYVKLFAYFLCWWLVLIILKLSEEAYIMIIAPYRKADNKIGSRPWTPTHSKLSRNYILPVRLIPSFPPHKALQILSWGFTHYSTQKNSFTTPLSKCGRSPYQ